MFARVCVATSAGSGDVWAPREEPTHYNSLTSAARLSWSHLPTSSHERLYVHPWSRIDESQC